MVIEDLNNSFNDSSQNYKNNQNKSEHNYPNLASPFDRLAAFVVDMSLVIGPIWTLLIGPMRVELTKSVLLKFQTQIIFWTVSIFLFSFLLLFLYQSLMTWKFGGTIGKLIWGIRVHSVYNDRNISLSESVRRSFFWILDVLLLLLPNISLFINPNRRAPHDRLSDTIVLAYRKRGIDKPGLLELSFFKGVVSAIVSIVIILALYFGYTFLQTQTNYNLFSSTLEKEGSLCKQIGEASNDWPNQETSEYLNRLQIGLTLYAAGELDKECLEKELVASEYWGGEPSGIEYLVKSFVYSKDQDLSDRYLKNVCVIDSESDACIMSKMVEVWSTENKSIVSEFVKENISRKSLYLKIWALRHMVQQGDFENAQSIIQQLPVVSSLGNYVSFQKVKVLWGLNENKKANDLSESTLPLVDPITRIDMSSWLCSSQSEYDCGAESTFACDKMMDELQKTPAYLYDTQIGLTYLRNSTCNSNNDLAQNQSIQFDRNVDKLNLIIKEFKTTTTSKLRTLLWTLYKDGSTSDEVKNESLKYILRLADTSEDIMGVENEWMTLDKTTKWEKLGFQLFYHYFRLKNYQKSWDISSLLDVNSLKNFPLKKELVVVAFKTGNKNIAFNLIKEFKNKLGIKSKITRGIASTKNETTFDDILNMEIKE